MIPASFEYHRPGSVDEVVSLLAELGEEGRVLAGGHSLIPMMKLRLAEPAHLIDHLIDRAGLTDRPASRRVVRKRGAFRRAKACKLSERF